MHRNWSYFQDKLSKFSDLQKRTICIGTDMSPAAIIILHRAHTDSSDLPGTEL